MEIYLSKRKTLSLVLVALVLGGLALFLAGLSGRTLPELTGIGSGRSVALAGAKAFYSIDYQDGPDVWAARLCAVSTKPACELYQSIVAPFLWLEFEEYHSLIVAETGKATLLSKETAGTRGDAPMQVWQVTVNLSDPWPQGDGQTSFPAYVLVIKEESGWKFERFLLSEEIENYSGGDK
jgi:hypothetical protein